MVESIRALLTGILDYAGLFPPAELPLEQAVREFAHHRQEADTWLLGRFVCPAGKLAELEPWLGLFSASPPPRLSVLAGTMAECQAALAFQERTGIPVDMFELRPGTPLESLQLNRPCFLEQSPEQMPRLGVGFKLRCGGLNATAFPSCEQVAGVVARCRDAGVPLKFTAGLHHPIRRFDLQLQVRMHGFINVFVAGVLAHAHKVDAGVLRAVLEDENAAHFVFTDDGVRWQGLSASTIAIQEARRLVTSFGSCSFTEPRDDLRQLGWL